MFEASIPYSHASFLSRKRTIVGGIAAQIQSLNRLGSRRVASAVLVKILHPLTRVRTAHFTPDVLFWSNPSDVHGVPKGLVRRQVQVKLMSNYCAWG